MGEPLRLAARRAVRNIIGLLVESPSLLFVLEEGRREYSLRAGISKSLHFYFLALLPEATEISPIEYYPGSGASLEWIELDAIDRAPFARPVLLSA
jgi:ADP-ribose pyrophosphatase YjhB (NUDIX family)